ncbi:MAG: Putative peroxiredoxin bcp [Bacteroidetes bacterium MED-G17]|nr:MAG: Putative peroxiredoxin bcp [Bacteroidetes bacterium MED-G17]
MQLDEFIPEFTLVDENGEWFSSESLSGKPTVILFYPMDFTPGCVTEACTFRDNFDVFDQNGATVLGISKDSPSRHKKFKQRYRLPFTLLSDLGGNVAKSFGVKTNLFGLMMGRETFVFDKNQRLISHFVIQLQVKRHVQEAIKAIQKSQMK